MVKVHFIPSLFNAPSDPCEDYDGIAIKQTGETICCAKSCGSCGGPDCDKRPGRKSKCCSQNILSSGQICGLNGNKAPCMISGMSENLEYYNFCKSFKWQRGITL